MELVPGILTSTSDREHVSVQVAHRYYAACFFASFRLSVHTLRCLIVFLVLRVLCSQNLDKKKGIYNVFLLTGFVGFDGDWQG